MGGLRDWRWHSLRVKLTAIVLLACVPIGLLLGYLWVGARERDQDDALRSLTQIAQAVAVIANDIFDDGIIAATALATDPSIASLDPARVTARLHELRAFYPQYVSIVVIDGSGSVVGWSDSAPLAAPPPNPAQRGFFKRVMSSSAPTVIRVSDGQPGDSPGVGAAAPIVSTEGNAIGVVALTFNLERIETRMSRVQLSPGQVLTLVDPAGRVAILTGQANRAAPRLTWEQRDRSQLPEVQAALQGQVATSASFRGPIVGQDRLAVFVPTPGYGWVVGATWTVDAALGPTRDAERRTVVAFASLVLVIACSALLASRLLTAPLQKLTDHVHRLGDGHFEPIDGIRTGDEIGELARTFNTMGARLRSTLDELRAERARLEAVVQHVPVGMVIRTAPDGQLMLSNLQAQQIWRLSAEAMADPRWYSDRPGGDPDGRPYAPAEWPLNRSMTTGEVIQGEEMVICRGDGTRGVLSVSSAPIRDAHGQIVAAVTAFIDVTEQRATEARLHEREILLSALIEQFPGAVSVVDRDFRYVLASRLRIVSAGLTADELIGRRIPDLYDTDHVASAVHNVSRALDGETVSTDVTGDGKVYRLITTPLRGASGEIQHVLGIGLDVTEERHQLERASRDEKLRALGHLAGGIAHDINQSLALVAGYGELALNALDQQTPGLDALREMIGIMSRAAYNGGESVKRLLTFARGQTNEPLQPIDVATLLHDVEQLTAPRWRTTERAEGRPVELRVEVEPGLTINAAPAELREALTNLIFNALDAMPRGGTIVLAARRDGDTVRIDVTDTGIGIPADVQRRVFEPFFTTKGEHGMGLGLAMVFGIVQRHGGQIDVTSKLGQGTTVQLSFPTGEADASAPPRADAEPAAQGLRILVVDDEPKLAALAASMAKRDGHHPITVFSGEAAIEQLRAEAVDLVLTDLSMGDGMNGWDLAAAIHERAPKLPVVLTTGWGAAIDQDEAHARGVCGVIAKPYHLSDLRAVISRVVRSQEPGVRRDEVLGDRC